MLGQLLFLGIKGTELTSSEAILFRKIQPGGFVLFSRNIKSAEQTRKLTDSLRDLSMDEPFIAIDNEGGRVWRTQQIGATPPSAEEMAKFADFRQIGQLGDLTAQHLQLLGINMNFAPVLDLDHHKETAPLNSLRGRCYGVDANDVIERAGLMNRRMRKANLLTCGKHFPSCGLALSDPHNELPTVSASLDELLRADFIPYTTLLPEMNAIMTAHVLFPTLDKEYPATLSKRLIQGLLRDQIGFEGVAITDDLDMGAIVNHYGRGNDVKMAIEAGNDMALICHQMDSVQVAYNAIKEINPYRCEESIARIMKQKRKIPAPIAFSESQWERNNLSIADLRTSVLGDGATENTPAQSPVEDY